MGLGFRGLGEPINIGFVLEIPSPPKSMVACRDGARKTCSCPTLIPVLQRAWILSFGSKPFQSKSLKY